jgi:pimeloyl-ACP methyl ester carboxylesterase
MYPIVKIKTEDGLILHGFLSEPKKPSKIIKINIHGTSGNFYYNDFYEQFINSANKLGIAHLTTNNRGSGVYEIERGTPNHGASIELFEDCLKDIDAWIKFALDRGYEKIILEGHSFGTEKSVYYMEKGKYKDKVVGVILLGFSDNVGTEEKYLNKIGKDYTNEAKDLVSRNEGYRLLGDIYGLAGELPISAQTYLNFVSENSENSKALPLRKGKDLHFFQNIKIPILGVIGDNEDGEYTIIPIKEAIELLNSENKLAEVHQIQNSNHGFEGKEKEVTEIIEDFIKRRILV